MIRAVIFDMGGTLLKFPRPGNGSWREAEDRGIRGIYRYLVEQGHSIMAHEDMFVDAMFQRLSEGWAQATGGHINLHAHTWIAAGAADHALTLSEAALIEAARRYARLLREGIEIMPGAQAALAALREGGYRIGLISNTIWPAELHIEDLDEQGLLPYLEQMVFSGESGIWKPDARIFRHMLDALDMQPEEAVFVGDNPREDIQGAQALGMHTIWVNNNEFPPGDVHPDAIVTNLYEVVEIVRRWQ